jgi:membrane protease YdiL (CAAX protease family)
MMKKLYDKSKLYFALASIAAYCILMSASDALSEKVGVAKSVTAVVGIVLCIVLFTFLKKNSLLATYGLYLPQLSAGRMLYYAPLLLLLSANLWHGVCLNYGALESVLYIISMLCVGFLEELIFRGLLFLAMQKDSPRAAVIVSSVTFGIGHIVNLVNGSGAELVPNLLQVIYATSAGFMFVEIFVKTKSLLVCIATHALFNSLSVFANESGQTLEWRIISCVLLTLISGTYALYIAAKVKTEENDCGFGCDMPSA